MKSLPWYSQFLAIYTAIVISLCQQSAIAHTTFSIEFFEHHRSLREQSLQRAVVNYAKSNKIHKSYRTNIDVQLISNNNNIRQYIAFEEARDFFVNIINFNVQKELLYPKSELLITLGFQRMGDQLFVNQALHGPGFSSQFHSHSFRLRSGYYLLPNYQQFYVRQANQMQSSSLWSSELQLQTKPQANLDWYFIFGYDYFHQLGTDIAFRSKFRNNSVGGNPNNAKFWYDFSIFSFSSHLLFNFDKWKVKPKWNIGINESAYGFENKHSVLGIEISRHNLQLSISHLKIDKNALVAVFTDESIDMTHVEGFQLALQYQATDKIALNFNVANLLDKETQENVFSGRMTATFWGEL